MRRRVVVSAGLAALLVAGSPSAPPAIGSSSVCNPRATNQVFRPPPDPFPANLPEVIDGQISTFWRTPGLIQQHAITIDLGCYAFLRRFRRYMTCDGTATSGPACNFRGASGVRNQGNEGVSYSDGSVVVAPPFDPSLRFVRATPADTTGWPAHPLDPSFFGALPYGLTPWLVFNTPVRVRYVQFTFVDLNDAVNEIELDFVETVGPLGTADLSVSLSGNQFFSSPFGSSATYTASVTNLGPATATNVRLVTNDDLNSWSSPSRGTCGLEGLPDFSTVSRCSFGTLLPGETGTVNISALVSDGTVTSVTGGASEPDPVSRNNEASIRAIYVDCEDLSQACPLLAWLGKAICEGRTSLRLPSRSGGDKAQGEEAFRPSGSRLPSSLLSLSKAASWPLQKIAGWLAQPVDLEIFYRLRDEVLRATPAGRRYIELYETHGAEISRLIVANSALRDRGIATLQVWEGNLRALVERQQGTAISAGQVSALQGVLEDLKRLGSSSLRTAIEREEALLNLPAYTGLTMDRTIARFQQSACPEPETSLCLNGGRFRASASWRDFEGNTGVGHAVPLTKDTGYFWFFSAANVELVVKALDGRTLNSNFWVFYGALSNVEYTLTVTDSQTGAVRTYGNPSGQFASSGDTAAFAGSGDLPPVLPAPPPAASLCDSSGSKLCLQNGRFEVQVSWRDFEGRTGTGRASDLTSDTGYFWFFSPENVEVVVKILDARALNGRFWVFSGALSNVEYTVTITDRLTGAVRTYRNPLGRFGSFGDTSAF